MDDFSAIANDLKALADAVPNIKLKEIDTTEPVDNERVEWYNTRFAMLAEDGVKIAITYYIEKAQGEHLNEHTLAVILQNAMKYM